MYSIIKSLYLFIFCGYSYFTLCHFLNLFLLWIVNSFVLSLSVIIKCLENLLYLQLCLLFHQTIFSLTGCLFYLLFCFFRNRFKIQIIKVELIRISFWTKSCINIKRCNNEFVHIWLVVKWEVVTWYYNVCFDLWEIT